MGWFIPYIITTTIGINQINYGLNNTETIQEILF
jgi:hypothetical protein